MGRLLLPATRKAHLLFARRPAHIGRERIPELELPGETADTLSGWSSVSQVARRFRGQVRQAGRVDPRWGR